MEQFRIKFLKGGDYVQFEEDCSSRIPSFDISCKTAAIYLMNGLYNEPFERNADKMRTTAYKLVHNRLFYWIELITAIVLMSLAMIEHPAVPGLAVDVVVHASLELLLLGVLLVGVTIKMWWLGHVLKEHKRTIIKAVILTIMCAEVTVVLVRQKSHFRVMRAVRPFLLLTAPACRDVRRTLAHTIMSLPPIVDVFVLLLFLMVVFAALGFYLFSPVEDDTYFQTMLDSFLNLFVLHTTANYPSVMMPAYNHNRWSFLYFAIFLVLEIYFLTYALTAVVSDMYVTLDQRDKQQRRENRREAAKLAFNILFESKMTFRHFCGVMKHYKWMYCKRNVFLMFRELANQAGHVNMEAFSRIYDVDRIKWRSQPRTSRSRKIVKGVYFRLFFDILIAVYGGFGLYQVLIRDGTLSYEEWIESVLKTTWLDITFVIIFAAECLLKIYVLGFIDYLKDTWNLFDLSWTVLIVLGLVFQTFNMYTLFVLVIRPLKFIRLFGIRQRHRDIARTLRMLLPKLTSMSIILLIVYYSCAIVGMEFFWDAPLENCCKNSSLESMYSNSSSTPSYFYLNNFENILHSYVTLFELTIGNDWHVIMYAHAEVTNMWIILYFLIVFFINLVITTVVFAQFIEVFVSMVLNNAGETESSAVTDVVIVPKWQIDSLVDVDPAERKQLEKCLGITGDKKYVILERTAPITASDLRNSKRRTMEENFHLSVNAFTHKDGFPLPVMTTPKFVDNIQKLDVNEDDVFIVTYPESGIPWMQDVVRGNDDVSTTVMEMMDDDSILVAQGLPSPRVFTSHLASRLLPEQIWQKRCKVIYIVRHPKDVVCSYYNALRVTHKGMFDIDAPDTPKMFDQFLDAFLSGDIIYGSWLDHLEDYSTRKDFVHFFNFEDMKKDPESVIKQDSGFPGLDEQTVQKILAALSLDAKKKSFEDVHAEPVAKNDDRKHRCKFIFKGSTSELRSCSFTKEQTKKFDEVFQNKVKECKLASSCPQLTGSENSISLDGNDGTNNYNMNAATTLETTTANQ